MSRSRSGRGYLIAFAIGSIAVNALAQTPNLPPPAASKAQAVHDFDIAPSTLRDVLERIAAAAALQLSIDRSVPTNTAAPGVVGRLPTQAAVERALQGSGLRGEVTADGRLIVAKDEAAARTTQLAPVLVTGLAAAESPTGPVEGYVARRSNTGLGIDVPLQDQPISVKVIPAEVIADLGVRNTTEVADYVAGVARETTEYSPNGQSFFIRGFSTYGSASTLNGFRTDGFLGVTDPSYIERIEFLKGPTSVLYGASSAISGLVNTVTKRPQASPFTTVELTGGSFGLARASIDANRPLGSADVLGRINIAAERSDGFRDYSGSKPNELFAITPTLAAQLAPGTRVEVEASAIRTRYPGRCMGVTADPTLLALSIRKEVICDDLAHASLDTYFGRTLVEQQLGADWSVRASGYWSRSESQRTEQYALNDPPVAADGRTLERYSQYVDSYSTNAEGRLEVLGKLSTGAVVHRPIAGLDFQRTTGYYAFSSAPATPMDIVDTRYDGKLLGPYESSFPPGASHQRSIGIFAQDFVELGAQWKLLVGVRHDRARTDSLDGTTRERTQPAQNESATSPRAGLVYEPLAGTSIYASWARSFSPNVGTDIEGNPFKAERGTQREAGVKQELLDRRLAVNAAVFDLERRNVLTTDPNDPTGNFSITSGRQRSRGAELELSGRILPSWDVIAAYTHLDAKVTEDNVIPVSDHLVGAARNFGSVWNKVNLAALSLPEWSVALGVVGSGDREARLPNIPITLGGFVRYDAAVYYVRGPWRVQVNGKNLANRRIFDGQGYDLVPQSPRAVYANVAYTF